MTRALRRLAALSAAAVLVACDGRAGASSSATTAGPSSTTQASSSRAQSSASASAEIGCAAAAALEARLGPLRPTQPGWMMLRGELLSGSEGEYPPKGSFVEIFDGAISIDGIPIESADAAAQALKNTGARHLVVLFAVGSPKRDVELFADVLRRAPADAEIYLLAKKSGEVAQPTPPWLKKKLDAQAGSWAKARALFEELGAATSRCPQVGALFKSLEAEDVRVQMPRFKRELPTAVRACGCEVDDARLGDLAAELIAGGARVVSKRVSVAGSDAAGPVKAIELGAVPDGEALYRALPQGGGLVALR